MSDRITRKGAATVGAVDPTRALVAAASLRVCSSALVLSSLGVVAVAGTFDVLADERPTTP
jgi:hypothetical protein